MPRKTSTAHVCLSAWQVEGPKLANMIQNGKTPVLPPKKLQEMGYTIVAYPMALLSASIRTMRHTLDVLKKGEDITHLLADFDETKSVVGFDAYYEEEDRYADWQSVFTAMLSC